MVKYVSGERMTKQTIRVTLDLTMDDLVKLDDLAHCVCTESGEDVPLEDKYQKFINKLEKASWRYVDYIEPKMKRKLSLCKSCNCMTKTIKGKCGKCKTEK